MKKKIKLWYLRYLLYRRYLAYSKISDRLDCGEAVRREISPSYNIARGNLNAILNRLEKIDPIGTPKNRF